MIFKNTYTIVQQLFVCTFHGEKLHTQNSQGCSAERSEMANSGVVLSQQLIFSILLYHVHVNGRRGGLMVSALVPGASGPASSRGHCVVFLGKTLNSHGASPSTQEYKWVPANCWGNLTNCGGVTCDGLASRQGGVEILLAASCYINRV